MSKTLLFLKEPRVNRSLGVLLLMLWCCGTGWSLGASALQQTPVVSGRVTDDAGGGMPGVNVLLKGSSLGTTTDADGRYNLSVTGPEGASPNAVLVFSFIGYLTQEQTIGSRSTIDVQLEVDVVQLTEVVVVGYGTQEKKDITAAISSLNKEALTKISTVNALDNMKGQMAGVDVMQASGRPGQAPSITIRGRRSINASNDPLIVVDGVPMTSGTNPTYRYDAAQARSIPDTDVPSTVGLQDFNPQDIESIEVLKDAAATAIYGSRGANGVVLITTKRGKAGKTTISYNGTVGVTQPFSRFPMMNGAEFADLKRESNRALINPSTGAATTGRTAWNGVLQSDAVTFVDPVEMNSVTNGLSTDWQDLVFQNGSQINQQLSVAGGSEKTQFNVSLGYFKEEGVISTMGFTKLTTRANLDHTINKTFKVGTSLLYSHSLQQRGGGNTALDEAVNQTPLGLPWVEPSDHGNEDLIFLPISDGIRSNPLNELVPGKRYDDRAIDRIFPSVYVDVNLIKGLKYKFLIGADISYNTNGTFEGQYTNARKNGTPSASYTNEANLGYTLENLLTYNKKIGSDHDFGATALQSIQVSQYQRHFTSVADLPYEAQKWYDLSSAPTVVAKESLFTQWQLVSVMGRVNYAYKGKYLLQASVRSDGSSRLAPGSQWTTFPGVSLGWRISDEGFLAGLPVMNDLKLRASYGKVGNTAVGVNQFEGKLNRSIYSWDEVPGLGYSLDQIPNPNLGWELTTTANVALDFGLFESRIQGTVEYYQSNTTDLLLRRNLPPSSGYANILENVGATQTNGVEVSLNTTVLDLSNGFRWNLDFNVTHYKEQIVDLAQRDANGNKVDDTGNSWFIGQPLRVYYDYNKIGIWQADEKDQATAMDQAYPGEIKVEDVDGDGRITPADRKILGTDVPGAYGGLTNRFTFKGVDLAVFLIYRTGFMIDSRFEDSQATMQGRYNNYKVDYWTIDNPTNAYPRPNKNQEFPQRRTTLRYREGDFLKLRNITLGYNFPASITQRLGMTSLRVYVTGQNLKAWSKYSVFDPETVNQVETGDIPPSKIWLGGLNITF